MDAPIHGYSRSELKNLNSDARPDRGAFCAKCQSFVPIFDDLTEEDVSSLRDLIDNGNAISAMLIIRQRTDCPLGWAKLWVSHPYGGHPQPPTPPCPLCGSQLRTPTARQCPSCFHSWHE
jgi:hypothetical protein